MARKPTSPPESPHLTVDQLRNRIGRIERCIADLEAFNPVTVEKRQSEPQVQALEAGIGDALSAAFGHGTPTYNQYRRAADLDQGPHIMRTEASWITARTGASTDYSAQDREEARRYLAEGKPRSIALLRQAVRTLKDQLEEEEQFAAPAPSAPIAPAHSAITDAEIRGRLLTHFYTLRHNAEGWVPTSDINMSPDQVNPRVIGGVCQQLADVGLIQWKPLRGSEGFVIGMAKITGKGVAAFEAGRSTDIDIRFASQRAPAASSPPVPDDAPVPEAAISEIRDVVSTIKTELPALTLSNSEKADVDADVRQIEIEIERPVPRRPFLKLSLESLRDNLAKAVGAAAATGLVGLAAILAKHFGVF